MAKQRKTPNSRDRQQIESKLRKIKRGSVEFISVADMKTWYGRDDDEAANQLFEAWREHCRQRNVPELAVVGPISSPRGYVIGRQDQQADWLYPLGS